MTVKELQHLAAAMAHEVRNPLNSMAIHVELLEGRLKKEGAGAELLKSLAVMSQEIDRVDKILEQYLSYAGPSEAARPPTPATSSISAPSARPAPSASPWPSKSSKATAAPSPSARNRAATSSPSACR